MQTDTLTAIMTEGRIHYMETLIISAIGSFIGAFAAVLFLFSGWDEEGMYDDIYDDIL